MREQDDQRRQDDYLFPFPRITILVRSTPVVAQNDAIVDHILTPVLLQKLVRDILQGNPVRLPRHETKEIVVLVVLLPV